MQYTSMNAGLRLKLRLQEVPELVDLPWELLFDEALNCFFAKSNQTPVVRYLDLPQRIRPLALEPPLELLVMVAGPRDFPALDARREKNLLRKALAPLTRANKIAVTFLERATLRALQQQLRSRQYHALHFIGHGGFDRVTQEGLLVLEDGQGRGQPTNAERLGALLHDHQSLRLAVLNACEGARVSMSDPYSGVATTLVQRGIPAVIAMQFEITDTAASAFTDEFYSALVDKVPVDAAVSEARKAIYALPNEIEWVSPVLYMRAPDGVLFTDRPERRAEAGVAAMTPAARPRARRNTPIMGTASLAAPAGTMGMIGGRSHATVPAAASHFSSSTPRVAVSSSQSVEGANESRAKKLLWIAVEIIAAIFAIATVFECNWR